VAENFFVFEVKRVECEGGSEVFSGIALIPNPLGMSRLESGRFLNARAGREI
jgi:hypothetical protein